MVYKIEILFYILEVYIMIITRMMIVYIVPRYASCALKLHGRNIPRSMSHFFVFFFSFFPRRYKKREKERFIEED